MAKTVTKICHQNPSPTIGCSIEFLRPVAAPRSEGDMGRRGWVTNLLYDARPGQNGPMEKNSQYGGRPYYYNELFLDMQHIVDFVFISKAAEKGLSYSFSKSILEGWKIAY